MDASALRRARELRGLSANALAAKLGVSQSVIWQIEVGRLNASVDLTCRIAEALDVPPEFLVRVPRFVNEGSLVLFRAYKSKLNKSDLTQVRQCASVLFEFVERLSNGLTRIDCQIPRSFGEQPEFAAERMRALLGYAPGEPIGNLTRRLEKLGVTILKAALPEDSVFGFSTWVNDKVPRPFFILNHHQTAYRLRWTIAHELGHIVLGHEYGALPIGEADKQADRFAGALLVPSETLAEDILAGASLSALSYLKKRYGVSIAALARRSYEMNLIEHHRYESLNVQISRKHWRKKEPGDDQAECEEPDLIQQLIKAKYGEGAIKPGISADLGFPHDIVFPAMLTTKEFKSATNLQKMLS
jgi:Zn-dependent peptidase ImmA (M78 family)/transcriptional regulator with XRE-family HTH domain